MSSTTLDRAAKSFDPYLKLIHRLPLRPIRSEADYGQASEVYSELADRAEARSLADGETEYMEVLGRLVNEYDESHSSLLREIRENPITPLQALKVLLEENAMGNGDLAKLLGIGSGHASLILNGKRGLSKANIRILAERFRVNPSLFL